MAAGDGDVKLGTLGSSGEHGGDGSPGGAGATAAGSSWAATLLATGGEMLLNVALVALVLLGAYRLWVRWGRRGLGAGPGAGEESPAATLPRMKKRDFSLEQLRQYDGARTPRILLAVNGKVFDVTKGSKFYGPGEESGVSGGPGHPTPAAATHLDSRPVPASSCGRRGLQGRPTNLLSGSLPFPPRVPSQPFLGLKFSKFFDSVTLVLNLSPELSGF